MIKVSMTFQRGREATLGVIPEHSVVAQTAAASALYRLCSEQETEKRLSTSVRGLVDPDAQVAPRIPAPSGRSRALRAGTALTQTSQV